MHDLHTNQPMWNDEVNINGGPRVDWPKANHLDGNSSPADWFQAFLPVFDGSCRHPWVSNTPFWMHKWTNTLNVKAASMGAGVQGGMYPDFKPFSYGDIEKHLALYILQGLNPLQQDEQIFASQANDCDLCFCVFGSNAIRHHHHFKAFFCIQDPTKKMPCRKEHPTYKVTPFVHHVHEVSMLAWHLGCDISGDEQTIGFQGKHSDKLHLTYRAEGDGFQCDAPCESGFTFTFYFHNQPALKKYLQQGYAPLHSRILGMFDQLDEKHHNCWFDNLFLCAKFCRAAFTHSNVVHIAVPTRKSGHGLPQCILQEEVQGTAEIRHVRGTVKAAVLEGDGEISGLVAVSYCDQKPVHFLSTICETIKWVQCTKRVYCVETEQVEEVKFLHLNINDDYNPDMGNVDIADQLQSYYRFDHWMRKQKWWWSLFFCAFGVLLVNAYVCYHHYTISIGKCPISHYDSCKSIALALLDPKLYWKNQMVKRAAESNKRNADNNVNVNVTQQGQGQDSSSNAEGGSTQTTKASSNKKQKRAPPVTDDSLCPPTGAL